MRSTKAQRVTNMSKSTVINKLTKIHPCPHGSGRWQIRYYVKDEQKSVKQLLFTKSKTEARTTARQLYQKLVGKSYAESLKVTADYRSAHQANIQKQLAERTKNIKENTKTCKTRTLFNEIVHRYHPEFKSKSMLKLVEKHPGIFNIGHLIELTMAEIGGYDVVDGHGYDFSDGTECKTASVMPTASIFKGTLRQSYPVYISGVVQPITGAMKTGDIRAVVYNPHIMSIMFYYIPHKVYKDWYVNKKGSLMATYNSKKNVIPKWEPYRVDTFKQLATIKPKVLQKYNR